MSLTAGIMDNKKNKPGKINWDQIEDLGFKALIVSVIVILPLGSAILMYFFTKM